MSEQHAGGCLCGAIRFRMSGAPTSTNVCTCTQCQRQTGAPLPSFATCDEGQLEIVAGVARRYRSSVRAVREFCEACGSCLFWREDGNREVDVFLGAFDEPGRLPPPEYAIWAAHAVPWLSELSGIRSYAGRRLQ